MKIPRIIFISPSCPGLPWCLWSLSLDYWRGSRLSQKEIANLFRTTKQSLAQHKKQMLAEKEVPKNSVVKESFTTATDGNRQGFLDSSSRWQFHGQHRVAEALEADCANEMELGWDENQLLKKPEDKGE